MVLSKVACRFFLSEKGGRPPLPSNIRDEVTNFFKNDFIYVHNVTRRLAEDTRNLVWNAQVDPKDAIHVATAIQSSIPLLNTYDGKLLARNGVIGAPSAWKSSNQR